MPEEELCRYCNTILVRKDTENACNFKLRNHCNAKCARAKDKANGHWREPNWINSRKNSFGIKE